MPCPHGRAANDLDKVLADLRARFRVIHIISTPYGGEGEGSTADKRAGAEAAAKLTLETTNAPEGVYTFNPNDELTKLAGAAGFTLEQQGKRWVQLWGKVANLTKEKKKSGSKVFVMRHKDRTKGEGGLLGDGQLGEIEFAKAAGFSEEDNSLKYIEFGEVGSSKAAPKAKADAKKKMDEPVKAEIEKEMNDRIEAIQREWEKKQADVLQQMEALKRRNTILERTIEEEGLQETSLSPLSMISNILEGPQSALPDDEAAVHVLEGPQSVLLVEDAAKHVPEGQQSALLDEEAAKHVPEGLQSALPDDEAKVKVKAVGSDRGYFLLLPQQKEMNEVLQQMEALRRRSAILEQTIEEEGLQETSPSPPSPMSPLPSQQDIGSIFSRAASSGNTGNQLEMQQAWWARQREFLLEDLKSPSQRRRSGNSCRRI